MVNEFYNEFAIGLKNLTPYFLDNSPKKIKATLAHWL